jgi:hypothetical protein
MSTVTISVLCESAVCDYTAVSLVTAGLPPIEPPAPQRFDWPAGVVTTTDGAAAHLRHLFSTVWLDPTRYKVRKATAYVSYAGRDRSFIGTPDTYVQAVADELPGGLPRPTDLTPAAGAGVPLAGAALGDEPNGGIAQRDVCLILEFKAPAEIANYAAIMPPALLYMEAMDASASLLCAVTDGSSAMWLWRRDGSHIQSFHRPGKALSFDAGLYLLRSLLELEDPCAEQEEALPCLLLPDADDRSETGSVAQDMLCHRTANGVALFGVDEMATIHDMVHARHSNKRRADVAGIGLDGREVGYNEGGEDDDAFWGYESEESHEDTAMAEVRDEWKAKWKDAAPAVAAVAARDPVGGDDGHANGSGCSGGAEGAHGKEGDKGSAGEGGSSGASSPTLMAAGGAEQSPSHSEHLSVKACSP